MQLLDSAHKWPVVLDGRQKGLVREEGQNVDHGNMNENISFHFEKKKYISKNGLATLSYR